MHTREDPASRAVGIVGLLGIGLIHLLDSIGKYGETRYIFWLYIALILGSIVAAGLLLTRPGKLARASAGALATGAIVGFVLSRTTGLPSSNGDVGNWTEPLGLASLFVEGCLVALSLYEVLRPRAARAAVADQGNGRRTREYLPPRVGVGSS
jgi:hypothetical protein